MCGSFGKPQGTVARLHTGQVTISICTKLRNKEHVIEVLPRAKFKFPGHPKTHLSKKWVFTKFNADECDDMVTCSCWHGARYISNSSTLDKGWALHS